LLPIMAKYRATMQGAKKEEGEKHREEGLPRERGDMNPVRIELNYNLIVEKTYANNLKIYSGKRTWEK